MFFCKGKKNKQDATKNPAKPDKDLTPQKKPSPLTVGKKVVEG